MKRVIFLVSLMMLVATLALAFGLHKKGTVKITNSVDTLNDTASGSGLAEYTGVVYGFKIKDYKNFLGQIVLKPSANAKQGYGLEDSAIIWLQQEKYDALVTVDSVACGGLPCTLLVDTVNSNFGSALAVKVYLNDSASDTVMTAEHEIEYEFIARE